LSINKKCILPKQLKIAHNYTIKTNIIVKSVKEQIDDTGNKSLYFSGELDSQAEITDENGEVIITKNTKSQSKLLRGQIAENYRGDGDINENYQRRMTKLRHFWCFVDEYLDELEVKEAEGKL